MRHPAWVETIRSDVPARLDRLPWARWHWVVMLGLGLVWVLDGLEATMVGAVGAHLTEDGTLGITETEVGVAASIYIAGAVVGALVFGYLNDRLGRRRVFLMTLSLYLLGTVATASAVDLATFALFRFITGIGIGGEYAAINSAIGELVPPRWRGFAYVAINGSWWLGATGGALLSVPLLDPNLLAPDLGWRLAFVGGALLGIGILVLRRTLPESPRWLMIHGRAHTAERVVGEVEREIERDRGERLPPPGKPVRVRQRTSTSPLEAARAILASPRRAALAGGLMVSQAFFYNAAFFTYALVLSTFYDVPSERAGLYLAPVALGSFLGPLALGPLFDIVGRRAMICATYLGSAVALAVTGWLFAERELSLAGMTIAWAVIFFVASAGASAAYLTVSELFPVEVRGMAIALAYAISTAGGGVSGPALFGALVETEVRGNIVAGYAGAAGLMALAGVLALVLGVRAERRSLEDVAPPLGQVETDRRRALEVKLPTDLHHTRPVRTPAL